MCGKCGHRFFDIRRGVVEYDEQGLFGIRVEGARLLRCKRCRAERIAIEDGAAFERAVVGAIARVRGPLSGAEVRYLRAAMGLSGVALARLLGVSASVLSRWENGHASIGPQSDRLLRTLAARETLDAETLDALLAVAEKSHGSVRATVRLVDGQWRSAPE